MSIKQITVVVHDDNNSGVSAVFDGEGKCIQGTEDIRDLVLDTLGSSAEVTPSIDESFDTTDE